MNKPIRYIYEMECRYSDLDIYGHLNSIRMLGMLMDSRHAYFQSRFKRPVADIAREGYAIYTTKLSCNYRQSVREGDLLRFESSASFFVFPVIGFSFKVFSCDGGVVLDGKFEQVFVDSQSGKPLTEWPKFMDQFFFENSEPPTLLEENDPCQ